jgi:hypothetical protein
MDVRCASHGARAVKRVSSPISALPPGFHSRHLVLQVITLLGNGRLIDLGTERAKAPFDVVR